MENRTLSFRTIILALLLAVSMLALAGCGDKEPEERRAFIAFLNDKVMTVKGVGLPELSGAAKKAVGRYAEHYDLLTGFQKKLADEAGKNASELLALAEIQDFAALAKAEKSLKKASREAEKLQRLVVSLRKKTDKAKGKLAMPDDLAAVYDTVYAKVVSLPAASTATAFEAVHSVFAAILDLLDFINFNSRDMEIDGGKINLRNAGLQDDLAAKMAAVREKVTALSKAYTEMMKTMLQ